LWLHLAGNRLSTLPDEFANLQKLDTLVLSNNELTGDITTWMSGLIDRLSPLRLDDGLGGNDCLTVTDTAVRDWLDARNRGWELCDNP